ncbi:DnaJ-domain-containing protein [Clavulina sp. PMI_390]|nr:DnaJ-domain-containing protein [Clavulina sp. PMI_390]
MNDFSSVFDEDIRNPSSSGHPEPLDTLGPSSPDSDYYALLNLPRNASEEDIREKWRQLAILLHPDKQTDQAHRDLANEQFRRVQEAYKVLSDPQRREIYDQYGEEGIRFAGQVGQRQKTAEEIAAAIRNMSRQSTLRERTAKSQGAAKIILNAGSLTAPRPADDVAVGGLLIDVLERLKGVRATGFGLSHTRSIPYGTSGLITIGGRVARGRQSAFFGTVRHQFSSRVMCQTELGALPPRSLALSTSYIPDPLTQVKVSTNLKWTRFFTPSAGLHISRVLFEGIVGTTTFETVIPYIADRRVKQSSTLVIGVQAAEWNINLGTGTSDEPILSMKRAFELTESTTVEVGAAMAPTLLLSIIPAALTVDVTQNWQDVFQSDLTVGFSAAIALTGPRLQLKFTHGVDSLVIPITLVSDVDYSRFSAVSWTLLPALALFGSEMLVLRAARDRIRRAKNQLLEKDVSSRRSQAEAQLEIIREAVSARAQQERLVILRASYGPPSPYSTTGDHPQSGCIDVTIAVQALVHNSQINIPGGYSKVRLP